MRYRDSFIKFAVCTDVSRFYFVKGTEHPKFVNASPPIAVNANCSAVTVGVITPLRLDGIGPETN